MSTIPKSNTTLPTINSKDDTKRCVTSVEKILNYQFKNKKLLEEALTHTSCTESSSYQRLEFVGDAILGLAFANFVYLEYPTVDPGILSSVRAANISTENLARVAVRNGLHLFVRHNALALDKSKSAEIEKELRHGGLVL